MKFGKDSVKGILKVGNNGKGGDPFFLPFLRKFGGENISPPISGERKWGTNLGKEKENETKNRLLDSRFRIELYRFGNLPTGEKGRQFSFRSYVLGNGGRDRTCPVRRSRRSGKVRRKIPI